MSSYQEQWLRFLQQTRAAHEALVANITKQIELYKNNLKATGLDQDYKQFLEAKVDELESYAKSLQGLPQAGHKE